MNQLIELLTKAMAWIVSNPEIFMYVLGLILVKSKIVTELEFNKAKGMLDAGHSVSTVTDETKLTMAEVEKHITTSSPDASLNTNKKKIQRALRAVIRGWL